MLVPPFLAAFSVTARSRQGDLMKRHHALVFWAAAGAAFCVISSLAGHALATASPAAASAAPASSAVAGRSWGTAEEVPGMATLNTGGDAQLTVVSCSQPGDCSGGGFYLDTGGSSYAFVVSEVNGSWGTPQEVPGVAALSTGDSAAVTAISCTGPGDCSAGGSYATLSGPVDQVFVVTETDGAWGTALQAATPAAFSADNAQLSSLSCGAPGDCSAAVNYSGSDDESQVSVVDQTDGTWSVSQQPSGLALLGPDGSSGTSVSCTAPGECTLTGDYWPEAAQQDAFVADETDGTWGTAQPLAGFPAGYDSGTSAVSCTAPGDCTAAGGYGPVGGAEQAFVAAEASGTWSSIAALPGSQGSEVDQLSCSAIGYCVAADKQAAVLWEETDGAWADGFEVPGLGTLGDTAVLNSVSCDAPGDCSAGGGYTTAGGSDEAFVVDESGGTWGTAEEVPGTSALNGGGDAGLSAVSCVPGGDCSAVGSYTAGFSGGYDAEAFVVGGGPTLPTSTTAAVSRTALTYGAEQQEKVTATVAAAAGEVPAGAIAVEADGAPRCMITVTAGTGSCALPATGLSAGSATLTASYQGNYLFDSSAGSPVSITVSTAKSSISLALSDSKVTYGNEQDERLSVSVSPQYRGTPTGSVTVRSGSLTVCKITLRSGSGSCRLSRRALRAGRHELLASYAGDRDFSGSTSARRTVTVAR
jgi:hypothetical protein